MECGERDLLLESGPRNPTCFLHWTQQWPSQWIIFTDSPCLQFHLESIERDSNCRRCNSRVVKRFFCSILIFQKDSSCSTAVITLRWWRNGSNCPAHIHQHCSANTITNRRDGQYTSTLATNKNYGCKNNVSNFNASIVQICTEFVWLLTNSGSSNPS
jgi:hypothetical protein